MNLKPRLRWIVIGPYLVMILYPLSRDLLAADSPGAAGLALAPLALMAVCVAVGMAWAAVGEKRLTGSAVMFGRGALLALGLLVMTVVLPMIYDHGDDPAGAWDRAAFGLVIWGMIVVPATGVMIAYHFLGDGSPKPGEPG